MAITELLRCLRLFNLPFLQNSSDCFLRFGATVSKTREQRRYVPNSFSICPLLALSKTPCEPCLFVTNTSNESTTSTRGTEESLRYLVTASAESTIMTKSFDFALYKTLVCYRRSVSILRLPEITDPSPRGIVLNEWLIDWRVLLLFYILYFNCDVGWWERDRERRRLRVVT